MKKRSPKQMHERAAEQRKKAESMKEYAHYMVGSSLDQRAIGKKRERGAPSEEFTRKLAWFETAAFMRWGCTGCGWARPVSRLIAPDKSARQDVQEAFDQHVCAKTPIYKRGNFSRIA